MANRDPVKFTTPVGRMIGGSCYEGSTTDDKGQPKVYKSGAKIGQPRTDYSVGIAIPKTQGHWGAEPGWGQAIWNEGHAAWPAGQAQRHDFAWKIVDGDSAIPNKAGRVPKDQTGYAGCWILWFGGTNPPPTAVAVSGPAQWNNTPGTIMPGDFIEVLGSVTGNESTQTAGVYLNAEAVCLRGYHADGRISASRPDLATAGFGGALPAGAVMQPAGNAMAPTAPPVPGAPAAAMSPTAPVPGVPSAPVPSPASVSPPAPVPTPVVPNPAILGAPAPVGVPQAPVPSPAVTTPPAPAARVMMPGCPHTYESLKAGGWSDQQMIEAGFLAP